MPRATPGWSCSACARPIPTSTWRWPPPAVTPVSRSAGTRPSLAAAYPDLTYAATEPSELDGLDLVFVALPHGQSQHLIPGCSSPRWGSSSIWPPTSGSGTRPCTRSGTASPTPPRPCSGRFVYGLPELHRQELSGARLIAAPGCYPTAAILALAPLIEAGALAVAGPGPTPAGQPPAPSLIVDAASGVSGAGRAPKDHLHFGAVDEDFVAYGLLDHRHTAEMEQALGAPVLFTPHLAPMIRGILATCYGRPAAGTGGADGSPPPTPWPSSTGLRRRALRGGPDDPPSTKATSGSNCAHVTVRVDPRTGWVRGHRRPRQPGQGGRGPGRPVRQPGPRSARGDRAAGGRGVPVSITTPEGFVAAGLAAGIKASGALDLALVATDGRRAGAHRGHLHLQSGRRRAGPGQPRPTSRPPGAGPSACVVSSGNANAATGDRGRADAPRMCALAAPGSACRPSRSWCAPPG